MTKRSVRRVVDGREECYCDECGWQDSSQFKTLRSVADSSVRRYRTCDQCRRKNLAERMAQGILQAIESTEGSSRRVLIVCKKP